MEFPITSNVEFGDFIVLRGYGQLEGVRDWCEQLIIAGFGEVMWAGHLLAKERGFAWANIPIYLREHAFGDLVMKSVN